MHTKNIELSSLLQNTGVENNLYFSKQEVMKHFAIGLDEENKKLFIVQQVPECKYVWHIVLLNHIKTHFLQRTYRNINAKDLKRGILEEYLEKITLYLELSNSKQPIEIIFYHHIDHNIFELPEIEQSARDWEIAISKSLWYSGKYKKTTLDYNSQYWQGF